MDVVVNATAISPGGGLTILEQFVSHALQTDISFYIFISEDIDMSDISNISFIKTPRMGWFSRIIWDFNGLSNFLKKSKINPDKLISLQNTTVNIPCEQIVYIHQPLPFYSLKSVLGTRNLSLILYYLFYGIFIFLYDNRKVNYVVQTNWLRNAIQNKKKFLANRINVCRPDYPIFKHVVSTIDNTVTDRKSLFYPAAPYIYKNHLLLIKALHCIRNLENVELCVTFSKGHFKLFDTLVEKYRMTENVRYLGFLSKDKLLEQYHLSHAMLFPSFIETFGLPLVEAAGIGVQILAADLPYAREVLNGYSGVEFIDSNRVENWRDEIVKVISSEIKRFPPLHDNQTSDSGWDVFFEKLVSGDI